MFLACASSARSYGLWSQHIRNSSIRSRNNQSQLRQSLGNAAFNDLIIYNEWPYNPTSCTLETFPRKTKTWPIEDISMARGHQKKDPMNPRMDCRRGRGRAVASLTVPGGQEFHFSHFFLKFRLIFFIFPQTLLIFFLILALRVGHPGRPWLRHWAEVAAREQIMWRHLSSQAVSAVMHDASIK